MSQWLEAWHETKPQKLPNKRAHDKMKRQLKKLAKAKNKHFDNMFLTMMIKHHAGAVRMSELVKEKGARPELLQFAEKVAHDQTAEIRQMEEWQRAWDKKKN